MPSNEYNMFDQTYVDSALKSQAGNPDAWMNRQSTAPDSRVGAVRPYTGGGLGLGDVKQRHMSANLNNGRKQLSSVYKRTVTAV